jgi:serine/threonine protein kinase
MAPENIGSLEYSEKSDVWSFGSLLVELVTGGSPFPGMDLVSVAGQVRDGRATALTYLPPDINAPSWIMELMQACFAFYDRDRPSFDDVVAFLTSHAPSNFELDPNEETLQEPVTEDDPKDRKRSKSHKRSPAGTKYAAIHVDPAAVEMDDLTENKNS